MKTLKNVQQVLQELDTDTMIKMPAGTDMPIRQVTRVPLIRPLPKRKRVAAYARVSAEKDASLHSLAAQISYYKSSYMSNSSPFVLRRVRG